MGRRVRGVVCGLLLFLCPALVHGGMALRYYAVSATDVNTVVTLTLPAKAVLIDNIGTNDVFVNVSGSGVAVATGEQNMRVRASTSVTLSGAPDESMLLVGVICATGQTATVYVTGVRAP